MHFTGLMIVLLSCAPALSAADPFTGTWKLNVAKSRYQSGTAPKEQSVAIMDTGNDLHVKIAGTAADGTRIAAEYTIPTNGGAGKVIESNNYDGISSKRLGPNEREQNYTKGGKWVSTHRVQLATGGNILTVSIKGVNAQGKHVDAEAVYDRQ